MKSYILFIAFAVAVSKIEANVFESHANCMTQEKLTDKDIQDLLHFSVTKDSVKCYLKCFMEREGFWVKGLFKPEKLREVIGGFKPLQQFAGRISSVLDKCQTAEGSNECEKAFQTIKCIVSNAMQDLELNQLVRGKI